MYAALAQLDRVFGYEPKGRGFESLTPCQKQTDASASVCFFRIYTNKAQKLLLFKKIYVIMYYNCDNYAYFQEEKFSEEL